MFICPLHILLLLSLSKHQFSPNKYCIVYLNYFSDAFIMFTKIIQASWQPAIQTEKKMCPNWRVLFLSKKLKYLLNKWNFNESKEVRVVAYVFIHSLIQLNRVQSKSTRKSLSEYHFEDREKRDVCKPASFKYNLVLLRISIGLCALWHP